MAPIGATADHPTTRTACTHPPTFKAPVRGVVPFLRHSYRSMAKFAPLTGDLSWKSCTAVRRAAPHASLGSPAFAEDDPGRAPP